MFLTSPFIDQALSRFDRWSLSAIAIFRQLPRRKPQPTSIPKVLAYMVTSNFVILCAITSSFRHAGENPSVDVLPGAVFRRYRHVNRKL